MTKRIPLSLLMVLFLVTSANAQMMWISSKTHQHLVSSDTTSRIHSSGVTNPEGGAVNYGNGYTVISGLMSERIRQDGYIRQVIVGVGQNLVGTPQFKFKVFRPNGLNYEFVGESEIYDIGTGNARTVTCDLSTPIPCQPGDVLGAYVINAKLSEKTIASSLDRYVIGDQTGTTTFPQTQGDGQLQLKGLTSPPFVAYTGDSIAEGHLTYHSFYHSGITGVLAHDLGNAIKTACSSANVAYDNYQNHAKGGVTFGWVATTGITTAVETKAKAIIVHCGINDAFTDRNWADVEVNLNAIAAALTPGQHLFIDEILPDTTDVLSAGLAQMAPRIRLWNGYLATWCKNNGATIIKSHDEMGMIRVATGELDDLATAYDGGDGVHLSNDGVTALAAIWKRTLLNYY